MERGYINGTGEEYVILVQDGDFQLCCSVGDAKYYMDDLDYVTDEPYTPNIFYVKPNDMGGIMASGMPEEIEALKDKYKIEIVSWKFSDPIDNSFK